MRGPSARPAVADLEGAVDLGRQVRTSAAAGNVCLLADWCSTSSLHREPPGAGRFVRGWCFRWAEAAILLCRCRLEVRAAWPVAALQANFLGDHELCLNLAAALAVPPGGPGFCPGPEGGCHDHPIPYPKP